MRRNSKQGLPKIVIRYFVILFISSLLVGCGRKYATSNVASVLDHPRVKTLLADLDSRGIKLTSPTNSFDPGLSTSPGLAFTRKPDYFAIHVSSDSSSATQLKNRVQTFVNDLTTGKNSLDMAGSVRYYRCDLVFVSYLAEWNAGPNPAVEKALTETCGPEIAHYPEVPSTAIPTSTIKP